MSKEEQATWLEQQRLRIMNRCFNKCRTLTLKESSHVSFDDNQYFETWLQRCVFWGTCPVLFFYAWLGILW